MCLSLRLKKNLMREGTTTFCHPEDEEEEEEEEGAKNDDFGISINRGKLRKNSRLGFSTKKKRSTQNFAFTQHLHNKKEQQSARSRVFGVCVCVCRFRATSRVNNTYTHTDRNGAKLVVWRRRPRRE